MIPFLIASPWRTATIALGILLLASNTVQQARVSHAQAGEARALAVIAQERSAIASEREQFQIQARQAEQAHLARITEIDKTYQKEKTDAQERAERVVAELRAGERRLRQQWAAEVATARLSAATATAAAGVDAAPDDRAAAIGRVLRIGAEADAKIRALQGVILSMQAAR